MFQATTMCVAVFVRAGLGRAPATALAYMYWLRGWQLDEAYDALTGKRRCSPRVEAIRAATADMLTDSRPCQLTVGIRRRGTAQTFQVGPHLRTTHVPQMYYTCDISLCPSCWSAAWPWCAGAAFLGLVRKMVLHVDG
jgi:hypothetical protein